jgi:hypothetical protein
MSKIRETSIEKYLADQIKLRGGLCIKLNPLWYKGIPDRLCVLHNRVAFVELKRPRGGRLSVTQNLWKKWLTDLSVEYHTINSRDAVDRFLETSPLLPM